METEDESKCLCHLLKLTTADTFSDWFDSDKKYISRNKRECTRPKKQNQKPRYDANWGDRLGFQHHTDTRRYIQDYNATFTRQNRALKPFPLQYGGPYTHKPTAPPLRWGNHGYENKDSVIPRSVSESELKDEPKERSTELVDSPKLKTLDDIKDYISDYNEDDMETKPTGKLKPKKVQDINLTGRFVNRKSHIKSAVLGYNSNIHKRRVVIKGGSLYTSPPAVPLVSYKLPTSLPQKPRPPSQSARLSGPRGSSIHQAALESITSDSPTTYRLLSLRDARSQKSALSHSSDNISRVTRRSTHQTTPEQRERNLDELVRLLGHKTLMPYLQKIKDMESRQQVGQAELFDYSGVFGLRR